LRLLPLRDVRELASRPSTTAPRRLPRVRGLRRPERPCRRARSTPREHRPPRVRPEEMLMTQLSNRHESIGADSKPVRFYDLRAEQSIAHKKTRRRGGVTVRRDPSTITGIVLHQTAVE